MQIKKHKKIRKLEQEEMQKWQKQFKNDLEKAGKKIKNLEFEKNKSKINNINSKKLYKFCNNKCPGI
ncbi:hypothetical protein [Spiroplasma endosymbiont of Aleiodes alternator]|uniref:hypothetical protein n=1 Tax=Spiroplasma endosymbiont of Aleiodes alternator TaxID=3139329 RepID=UPI003CCB52B3